MKLEGIVSKRTDFRYRSSPGKDPDQGEE